VKKLFTVRNLIILIILAVLVAINLLAGRLGLRVALPFVSVAAETIFRFGDFTVSNSLLTSWIVMLVLIILAIFATRRIPKDLDSAKNADLVPSGLANAIEWIIEGLSGMVRSIGGGWSSRYFPIVMTIFLFVITSNWLGLLPGFGSIGLLEHPHSAEAASYVANGAVLTAEVAEDSHEGYVLVPFFRSPSTDLNFTLALALTSVLVTQYFGVRALKLSYFSKFFNVHGFKGGVFPGIVEFIAGLLELIAEFAKIISFSFRLFGNVFAGEVLLGVMAFLIPYAVSLPFYGLELFVGFIQALVFMMLTLVFFASATIGHGGEAHH
jgi:F-type H+-transporting ATPase subunit a